MTMQFDPDMLPTPRMLDQLRNLNARERQVVPPRDAGWYTPMLLIGTPGFPLSVGLVGVIPVVFDCQPVGWTLSTNVPGWLTLRLEYADYAEFPNYVLLTGDNAPQLLGTKRNMYEEVPFITGWRDTLWRFGEIVVYVDEVITCEQVELVLYLKRR